VSPVDWDTVIEHVETLAKANHVQGPITHRGEAETNEDLWLLALLQEQASDRDHAQMAEIPKYLRTVAAKAQQVALPKCTLTLRLRRVPCDNGD
jgi:hypothetical protein